MDSSRVRTSVYLEQIFYTTNLAIVPALIGANQEYVFQNLRVSIHMPGQASVSRRDDDSPATWGSFRRIDGVEVPEEFNIHQVVVRVQLVDHIDVAPEMLTRHANASELLSLEEQSNLDAVADSAHEIAIDAFAYWTAVMRWVTRAFLIGRPNLVFGSMIHTPVLRVAANDQ